MSKTVGKRTSQSIKTRNNQYIEDYLDNYSHSRTSQISFKCALNLFFKRYNKPLLDVEIIDIKSFFNFLVRSKTLTLVSKGTYMGTIRRFLKDFIENNMKHLEPVNALVILFFLNNTKNFIWKGEHKESERDTEVILEKKEICDILKYLKMKHFPKYLMIRVLTETGMRKGELLSIDLERIYKGKIIKIEEDLAQRLLRVKGKKGKKAYYITINLARILLKFVEGRRQLKVDTRALFISQKRHRFGKVVLNHLLSGFNQKRKDGKVYRIKGVCEILGIDKKISPQVFRRTLNDYREQMDCPKRYLRILLNHEVSGVNYKHYVSDKTKMSKFLQYYDKFNPYKSLKF